MKIMGFCDIAWEPFAKGEGPQLPPGLHASVFPLFVQNANIDFQYPLLEGRFLMDGLFRRRLNSCTGNKFPAFTGFPFP